MTKRAWSEIKDRKDYDKDISEIVRNTNQEVVKQRYSVGLRHWKPFRDFLLCMVVLYEREALPRDVLVYMAQFWRSVVLGGRIEAAILNKKWAIVEEDRVWSKTCLLPEKVTFHTTYLLYLEGNVLVTYRDKLVLVSPFFFNDEYLETHRIVAAEEAQYRKEWWRGCLEFNILMILPCFWIIDTLICDCAWSRSLVAVIKYEETYINAKVLNILVQFLLNPFDGFLSLLPKCNFLEVIINDTLIREILTTSLWDFMTLHWLLFKEFCFMIQSLFP